MTNVTLTLSAIEKGGPSAAEQLLPLVYYELQKLAAQKMAEEPPGQRRHHGGRLPLRLGNAWM